MNIEETGDTKITFLNQPKLSGQGVDKTFDERREKLVPYIEQYLSTVERFKGMNVEVSFAETGISSFVVFLTTINEKYVLKIPLSHTQGEAHFLTTWAAQGVRVPQIFEEGSLNNFPYILMEYIDAPVLTDRYSHEELIEEGVYKEVGELFRSMHSVLAPGYGQYIDGQPEFQSFTEWIQSKDIQKHIAYVQENRILDDEHGSITKAIQILTDYVEDLNETSYCHFDFSTGHVFDTQPRTVFDPAPRFNNRYIDLGRTIVNYLAHDIYPSHIIEGYFKKNPVNIQVLFASVLLNSYMKLTYQHKKKRTKFIENIQKYLKENASLLDK